MFVAMNDEWYLEEYPELSVFIKNSSSDILPDKYRIFTYLNNEGQYRYSKHTTISTPELGIVNCTQLTFPPFGYVLTMNFNHDITSFVNITNFKNSIPEEKVDLKMGLYKLPTYLQFSPLDYRSKEKIEK